MLSGAKHLMSPSKTPWLTMTVKNGPKKRALFIKVPGDPKGSFKPQFMKNTQRRLEGLDKKV
jgi:transposase-like protein